MRTEIDTIFNKAVMDECGGQREAKAYGKQLAKQQTSVIFYFVSNYMKCEHKKGSNQNTLE